MTSCLYDWFGPFCDVSIVVGDVERGFLLPSRFEREDMSERTRDGLDGSPQEKQRRLPGEQQTPIATHLVYIDRSSMLLLC